MPITMDAWTLAVATLLADKKTVERKTRDGKTETVEVHETDPPENARLPRGMRRPGPLPELVPVEEVSPRARTETHEHAVAADADLAHMARVVVTEARRVQARGIALRDPVETPRGWTLAVVNVLS